MGLQNIGFLSIPESIFSGIQNPNSGTNLGIEIFLINAPYHTLFMKTELSAMILQDFEWRYS